MKYPHDFESIIRVFNRINNRRLRYCYFDKEKNVDYDEFIECRDEALELLISKDYDEAEEFIKRGEQIFHKDPDMNFIKGIL